MEYWVGEDCEESSPFHHPITPLLQLTRGKHTFCASARRYSASTYEQRNCLEIALAACSPRFFVLPTEQIARLASG